MNVSKNVNSMELKENHMKHGKKGVPGFEEGARPVNICGLTKQNLLHFDAMNNQTFEQRKQYSPDRIFKRYIERQQRAEMLRAQMEQNRRQQLEKIRAR